LYGLGERFVRFDQRGRKVGLWNTDAWGTTTGASYKGCPIVLSSAGYTVFLNTGAPVEADLGATSAAAATLTVEEAGLDCFIFLGPDLRAILGAYTALTGRMPRPSGSGPRAAATRRGRRRRRRSRGCGPRRSRSTWSTSIRPG
jgi:alpha-D-xyloside xylohydrolase